MGTTIPNLQSISYHIISLLLPHVSKNRNFSGSERKCPVPTLRNTLPASDRSQRRTSLPFILRSLRGAIASYGCYNYLPKTRTPWLLTSSQMPLPIYVWHLSKRPYAPYSTSKEPNEFPSASRSLKAGGGVSASPRKYSTSQLEADDHFFSFVSSVPQIHAFTRIK